MNVELNDIKNQTIVPYAFLFLRAVPVGSGSDLLRFTPNPDTNISEYKIPSSHVRSNYSQPQSRSLSDSPSNPQIKMSRESRNSRPGSLGTRGTALNPMSNQGFAIRLENLLNFLSKSHIRFQVTIQEDDKIATDSLGRECRWMSDVLNALATDVVAARGNRRIPGTKVFADKTNLKASDIEFNAMQNAGYRGSVETGHNIIEINKETQFSNNFYLSLEQAN